MAARRKAVASRKAVAKRVVQRLRNKRKPKAREATPLQLDLIDWLAAQAATVAA